MMSSTPSTNIPDNKTIDSERESQPSQSTAIVTPSIDSNAGTPSYDIRKETPLEDVKKDDAPPPPLTLAEKKKKKKLSLEEVLADALTCMQSLKNLTEYHNDVALNSIRDIGKHYWDYVRWRPKLAKLLLDEDYAGQYKFVYVMCKSFLLYSDPACESVQASKLLL